VQDSLEEKLVQLNMKVQLTNIKKCVLDSMNDLVVKVKGKARKPWITQQMINKMENKGSGRMSQ
jgi:hypothetical protein